MDLRRTDKEYHSQQVLTHIGIKGLQLGSLVTPVILLLKHRSNLTAAKLFSGTWKGAIIASIVSVGLGVGRLSSLDTEQIFNRSYRLSRNAPQNRCDQFSFIGAGIGVPVGLVLLPGPVGLVSKVLGGAAFGMAGGVLAHVATSKAIDISPNAMIEELKDAKENFKETKEDKK